jgi:hypothetical protein
VAKTVSWKDEGGGRGPCVTIDEDARTKDPKVNQLSWGMPYGYKPEWMIEHGWVSRRKAQAIACAVGVKLTEW